MLVIKPDECIDCGVCEPECPVDAIKADTEPGSEKWLGINTQYSEAFDEQINEAKEAIKEDMTGKLDEYINYLSEQWLEENKVAIESSLKVEVAESFMSGLKGLIEAHNVILPEDNETDVLASLESRVEELEGKLEDCLLYTSPSPRA